MRTYILTLPESPQGDALLEHLRSLEFVELDETEEEVMGTEEQSHKIPENLLTKGDKNADPMGMWGLMPELTLEDLRKKAWGRD